jgi:hypothetical protein
MVEGRLLEEVHFRLVGQVATGNPGLTPIYPGQYPYTEPTYQQFTAQQILQQPGVQPPITDS